MFLSPLEENHAWAFVVPTPSRFGYDGTGMDIEGEQEFGEVEEEGLGTQVP